VADEADVARAHPPHHGTVLLPPRPNAPADGFPALCLESFGGHQDHRVPRAPVPGMGVPHQPGCLKGHLRGRYSSCTAPPGACVRPRSSPRLGGPLVVGSVQVVARPCWTMALPDMLSAISLEGLGPIPRRVRQGPLPISSPTTAASRHGRHVWHTGKPLQSAVDRERIIGAAVMR
jgi:hypothetical protein